jgi:rhodanese-related sulfurtransferase
MSEVHEVDVRTAHERMAAQPDAVYLDVRTPGEYDQGHPAGAWNVPILLQTAHGMAPNPEFVAVARATLPRDVPVFVGCKSGQRSRMACQALAGVGFTNLVHVAGGWSGERDVLGRVKAPGWFESDLPTATQPTPGRTWDDLRSGATLT